MASCHQWSAENFFIKERQLSRGLSVERGGPDFGETCCEDVVTMTPVDSQYILEEELAVSMCSKRLPELSYE